MHPIRKTLAWVLAFCLLLSLLPAVSAEGGETCAVTLTGNTGAVLTCNFTPRSAEVDDNDLAIVEIRGNTVRVLGREGARVFSKESVSNP